MKKKLLSSLVLTLAALLILVGCSNGVKKDDGEINVVTTTDFYGEVATAVVGTKGKVTAVINSSKTDPHDFEPTTKTAKQVDNADLVIQNGLGYDSWMKQLIKVQNTEAIDVGVDVAKKKTGDNPHIWYYPEIMSKLADRIAADLGGKYPTSKDYFRKNAEKYKKSLKPMQELVAEMKNKYLDSSNKVAFVSEPVFDYSIKALGFKIGNPEFEAAIEKETDPSPQSIEEMRKQIKQRKVRFFVVNEQVDNPVISELVELADKNNVPVLKVTETLPEGKTYIQWMTDTYKNLERILLLNARK
ncbi:ABC-type metal ion transport system, periplasmic component surface adhesin [Amylolactobacillus amylotrophicus DSM 20534]|uniref:ABC-type metal ion transport system, periplasmic component surface adhesin n=2 Tax=Amylolactobacillus TaxID=2767876 RepID=A0A0R1YGS1_9LACO|nr:MULTISPECIES: zinc ABC transporter substrate-binding protein [Amylolactobacillus]KRK37311.1 ABC-type metal ion transport system, periplasmic component surface adhesin [Amylolactobacillus amylotrophicus DSM 20534]KRM41710.1 ABC-type metal ion transport system, periplasmic component surface adhesin [Amylolactobacillus amylophilus DSM 20533 = JCM 1125]GED80692.1 ABC transporter substrate-binding protein [Amylolactobacillus amylophilus]